ncbi:glycosyltransferase [Schlegelella sp. S2-27]|uniref:Glycosyltransferase n=1 Tax=Caldimonas mangrovi TaxID=2944811 RepID=A0ABT0YMS9_9BURK|nr:glycosyltransferase [Caldimonas mangrovi]MCM5679456.1 glycosyltransferase [Caldimonas mangrovi]
MVTSIHVLGSRELGGADRFFIRLVEALTRAGHPTLAVTRPGSPVAREMRPEVEQLHLPLAAKWDLYSRWRLTRLIAERRPDVVQTYMGRATRLTRLPRHSPALHVARLGGFYKIRGYYEHAHAWVGNTQAICDYLKAQGLPSERIFHIGNFVPQPRDVSADERRALRQQLGLSDEALVVFALGRLIEKKGFADLLRAWAATPADAAGPPAVLVIAGDGPDRQALESLSGELGLRERVRWAGWQNDPTPFYALADLFVCPSRHEPLGNVILEAWQHRLPVLSTRNEGATELVDEGVNGLLAPLSDPAGLAQALSAMLALPSAERRRLADAGHRTVQAEHHESAVVNAYLALYERLAAERRSGR